MAHEENSLFSVPDLGGRRMPDIALHSTDDADVNLSRLSGLTVIYAYPRTSPPDGTAVSGWSDIPGAKGCTPQSCGFRDHFDELRSAGVAHVFGLSTQVTSYQKEVVTRLHLPFALLSDADLSLQRALSLPTFDAGGMTLLHRVTIILRDGVVQTLMHKIDDPSTNADDVLEYLSQS